MVLTFVWTTKNNNKKLLNNLINILSYMTITTLYKWYIHHISVFFVVFFLEFLNVKKYLKQVGTNGRGKSFSSSCKLKCYRSMRSLACMDLQAKCFLIILSIIKPSRLVTKPITWPTEQLISQDTLGILLISFR